MWKRQQLRWELTERLTAEDDVLLIPLCAACVAGMQVTHAPTGAPKWPREPEGHKIV